MNPLKRVFGNFFSAGLFISFLLFFKSVSGQYDFSETDRLLKNHQHLLGNDVVTLVYKDGKIIFSKEQGRFKNNTEIPVASCSKWLTAAMVMTFVDEGKLSLDDSIGKFLPVFTRYGKGDIKIRNCLSHTTGLESGAMNLFSILREYRKRQLMDSLGEEVNGFAKNKKRIAEPGTEFRYSNIGLNIAGHILEVISGKKFEVLFQERIAIPLDMAHTSFTKGRGLPDPSGSAFSTANDYMHFLIMILQKGVYNGKRILSEKSVNQMQKPQISLGMVKYAPSPAEGYVYALGEWVEETDKNGNSEVVASPGLFGTWPLVDNCHQYACIFLIQSILSRKQRDVYVEIKKSIDQQILSSCTSSDRKGL